MIKNSISACIITKNEEKMLPDCLQSLAGVVDEIVVVDTGSTDKTLEFAAKFGAKIHNFDWNNDFSAVRNESIKYASGDFILIIDADERLLNPEILLNIVKNYDVTSNIGGYLCNIISTAANSDGTTEKNITKILRFFRNAGLKFEGIIHEQAQQSILTACYKLETSEITLLHKGYDLPAAELEKKQLRNLELLQKQLELTPNNSYYLLHLARTLAALARLSEAESIFKKALANSKNDVTKVQILNSFAKTLLKLRKLDAAKSAAEESLKLLPEQSEANFILAETSCESGNFASALGAYLNVRKMQENLSLGSLIVGNNYVEPEILHWKIGKCLLATNDLKSAAEEFENGLKIASNNPYCLVGIANIAYKLEKFDIAKKVLEEALKFNPNHQEISDFVAVVDTKINSSENMGNYLAGSLDRILKNEEKTANFNVKQHVKGKLSLCMIVKNEEKMLTDCLQSIAGVVDEIIIVDTGSTDKTLEIAAKFGAKIHNFDWCDDFSAARNESIKHSNCEWILYLDADERLAEKSAKKVRILLDSAAENVGAYFCTIESEHYKLDGGTEKHRGGYPRLFRNLGYPKIKFVGRVHEQISPSIIANNKILHTSDIVIEHLGYNLSSEEMHAKVQRNYKMLLAHIQEEPINGYAWFQLGQTLGQMQLMEQAEEAIRFSIKCGNLSSSVYASAAATLSQLCGRKRSYEESLHWANETLAKVPKQIYGLSLQAHALLYLGRKAEAEQVFLQALEISKSSDMLPRAGFDIEISEEVLNAGLAESRKK